MKRTKVKNHEAIICIVITIIGIALLAWIGVSWLNVIMNNHSIVTSDNIWRYNFFNVIINIGEIL